MTGRLTPKPGGGRRHAKLDPHRAFLLARVAERARRIFGDGVKSSGGFGFGRDFNSVTEFDTLDDFRQLILALQSSPSFRRRHHQLENHEASGGLRQRAFHADCTIPDRRQAAGRSHDRDLVFFLVQQM